MASLQTTYMGLKLKSPIIAASSGLTRSIENLIEIEKEGAGAVVLKSLFEEQLIAEANKNLTEFHNELAYPEAFDYISHFTKTNSVNEYLELIEQAKQKLSIPVIASVNCYSNTEWISYAKKFQDAGADAIELNIFILPSNIFQNSSQIESIYLDIINNVKKTVNIPIAIKISDQFTSLAKTVISFSWTGINGIVLFNRGYSPDFDINTLKIGSSSIFSHPEEITKPLRWIALLSDSSHCDIAGSTGVHDGEGVVKLLLAGAAAVQICSVLYKRKFSVISEMNNFLAEWMKKHNYKSISDFKGKMSNKNTNNPSAFERVQFMKYFAGIE